MQLFKNRPLALICFVSVCLMAFAIFMNFATYIISVSVLALIVIISTVLITRLKNTSSNKVHLKRLICTIIFSVIAAILMSGSYSFFSKVNYLDTLSEKEITVNGYVENVRYNYSYAGAFEVRVTEINGEEYNIKAYLETDGVSYCPELDEYDQIVATGVLKSIKGEEKYLISDGFSAKLQCEENGSINITGRNKANGFQKLPLKTNKFFQSILREHTDDEASALTSALLLGNRNRLSDEVIRDFRRCGISHMLALSGLHMSIIVGFFDLLLKKLFVPKKLRCVILIISAVAYLILTGFTPSASRAVIMLSTVYIANILNDESESITTLFIALVVILVVSPYSISDVGLWMSFFATLGIILVSDFTSKLQYNIKKKPLWQKILINIAVSVIISITAVVSISLFSWLFFGEISVVSPLTNLIFSPIMTAILAVGLITLLLSPIPFLASVFGAFLSLICNLFTVTASYISHWEDIVVSLKYDFVPYIIIPMIAVLVLFILIKLKRKWLICIPPAIAVIAFVISINVYNVSNADKNQIYYSKEKRSETLVVLNTSGVSVCDISTGGFSHMYDACEYAYENNKTEIDNIIITHYHNYHVNALARICDVYMVRNVYLPEPKTEEEAKILFEISDKLSDVNCNKFIYKPDSEIVSGENLKIYISERDYLKRSSHPVFTVSVSNGTDLLTYATSAVLESDIKNSIPLKESDVIVFGSHGPTVKEFKDHSWFEINCRNGSHMLFTSPEAMLKNSEFITELDGIFKSKNITILYLNEDSYLFEFNN